MYGTRDDGISFMSKLLKARQDGQVVTALSQTEGERLLEIGGALKGKLCDMHGVSYLRRKRERVYINTARIIYMSRPRARELRHIDEEHEAGEN